MWRVPEGGLSLSVPFSRKLSTDSVLWTNRTSCTEQQREIFSTGAGTALVTESKIT